MREGGGFGWRRRRRNEERKKTVCWRRCASFLRIVLIRRDRTDCGWIKGVSGWREWEIPLLKCRTVGEDHSR
jgi:hypothetical protein